MTSKNLIIEADGGSRGNPGPSGSGSVVIDADIAEITKRLGDVLYYVAGVADYYNLDLDAIARQNMAQSTEFKKNRNTT